MVCPRCLQKTEVSNSRPQGPGFATWRRRRCRSCRAVFSTSERILTESVAALKAADGSLSPLRRSDIYASCLKALEGLEDAPERAERLSQTVLDKLFRAGQTVIEQALLEKTIFETLRAGAPLAGQRYLVNQLRRESL